jgi:hypothetical protein
MRAMRTAGGSPHDEHEFPTETAPYEIVGERGRDRNQRTLGERYVNPILRRAVRARNLGE